MLGLTPVVLGGLAGIAIALPALLFARESRMVRAAFALALGTLLVGVADPSREQTETRPARVVAVRTQAGSDFGAEALRARAGAAQVEVVDPTPNLAQRVAAACLSREHASVAVAMLWTGPAAAIPSALPIDHELHALTPVPPAAVDPAAIQLVLPRPLQRGRPGALELRVDAVRLPLTGRVRVTGEHGPPVELALPAGAVAGRPVWLEWTPASTGTCELDLILNIAGREYHGRGSVPVAAPPRVVVVGSDAAGVQQALAVQGIDAQASAALPEDLQAVDVLIALDPIADQARVVEWVREGGGLLVVGGERGGALPQPEEPLAQLVPLNREPESKPDRPDRPGDGTAGKDPDTRPPEPKAEDPAPPPPPQSQPNEPQPESKPAEPPQPDLARGETAGAKPRPGPEVEVERRTIAMVLVIDCSGSMGGEVAGAPGSMKIEYARTSAFETARALRPGDELAVFGFARDTTLHVPLTPIERFTDIERGIQRLWFTPETTNVGTTLKRALVELAKGQAGIRHVVIISDGEIVDAPDVATIKNANDLKRLGVTLSLVRIAGDRDEMALVAAAERLATPGCYRWLRDPRELPRVVSLEVRRALVAAGRAPPEPAAEPPAPAGEHPAEPTPATRPASEPKPPEPSAPLEPEVAEPESRPKTNLDPRYGDAEIPVRAISDSVLLEPRPADQYPPLLGIVRTKAKPDAHVLLVAGDHGLPVLAFANRGAGRVAAWAGDFRQRYGARWLAEPQFPARLAQWVASLLPPLTAAAPAPALERLELRPPAPTAAEAAALAALAGSALAPVETFTIPAAARTTKIESRAKELALWALLSLGCLAVVEFLVRRRA